MPRPVTDPVVRFWEKVDVSDEDGCWVWQGSANRYGYGNFYIGGGKYARAHRFSYELFHGKILDGLVVMHHCDNPRCVNPGHLTATSQAVNMRDYAEK